VGAVEIARRAGIKKRFYDEPDWAKPVLMRMADRGILESDSSGPLSHQANFTKRQNKSAGSRRTSPKSSRKVAWKSKTAMTSPRTSFYNEL